MANQSAIRTPIVCVMGHVDHGKTSLLDRIRGSSVVSTEEGAITQHIGATLVPIDAIIRMSGALSRVNINVPGLLFIDTPGHHAFTTLRARGGALADMAIVVVDINEGFRPPDDRGAPDSSQLQDAFCDRGKQDRPHTRLARQ